LEATRVIREANPNIKVLLLTLHESGEILRSAFQVGAQGYLMKSETDHELLRALRMLVAEQVYISPKADAHDAESVLREIPAPH
jgi:DNA-binding NarL/FixJ family response regulator